MQSVIATPPTTLVQDYKVCQYTMQAAATQAIGIASGSAAFYQGVSIAIMLLVVVYSHNYANKKKIFSVADKDKNRRVIIVAILNRLLHKVHVEDHKMITELLAAIQSDDPIDNEALRFLLEDLTGQQKKFGYRRSSAVVNGPASVTNVEMSFIAPAKGHEV